jgi:hypothetical protein
MSISRTGIAHEKEILTLGVAMAGTTSTPGTSSCTSLIDSLSQCRMDIVGGINKENLHQRVKIPQRLCTTMLEAMWMESTAHVAEYIDYMAEAEEPPENPLVVFVNCKSGGRNGAILKGRLQELIGEAQVGFKTLPFTRKAYTICNLQI